MKKLIFKKEMFLLENIILLTSIEKFIQKVYFYNDLLFVKFISFVKSYVINVVSHKTYMLVAQITLIVFFY